MSYYLPHLTEFKSRFLKCLACFCILIPILYSQSTLLLKILMQPLKLILADNQHRFILTGVAEGFLTHIKISIYSALFLSFPFFLWQIWQFIKLALFPKEKNIFRYFFFLSPFLFLCGMLFSFNIVVPRSFAFFIQFEMFSPQEVMPLVLEPRLSQYLDFVLSFLLGFGVAFQTPLVMFALVQMGFVQRNFFQKQRKYAFIIILIISAILTPPDVLSMILLAIPLYFFYEGTLFLLSWSFLKKNTKKRQIA